ncbi:hypothetical protein M0G74_09395 [Microbulbifer sp. CAU 1566]|uniref:hypothetical protein n=1 Tax=Microbulbifer sp. CAU 1566 TaxID=2933269 RepID=UPI00200500CB|nr:hypothetical protein [Microbulbifer sp. CAU 1566]MCK7597481.1 hypothetical protein [Microbulbifer sp. CAU 1566]
MKITRDCAEVMAGRGPLCQITVRIPAMFGKACDLVHKDTIGATFGADDKSGILAAIYRNT